MKNEQLNTTEKVMAYDRVLAAGRTPLLNKKFGVAGRGVKVENFSKHFYVMKYTDFTKRDWQFYFKSIEILKNRIISVMPDFDFDNDYIILGS